MTLFLRNDYLSRTTPLLASRLPLLLMELQCVESGAGLLTCTLWTEHKYDSKK